MNNALATHSHTIAFPSPDAFYESLYKRIDNILANGSTVIYALEPKTRPRTTVSRMQKLGVENIQQSLDEGHLTIIDPEELFYKVGTNAEGLKKTWHALFSKKAQKMPRGSGGNNNNNSSSSSSNRTATTATKRQPQKDDQSGLVVYSPEVYFARKYYDPFINFEQSMSPVLDGPVEFLCWYKMTWLTQLSFASFIKILSAHKYLLRSGWKYESVDRKQILKLADDTIDAEFGDRSSVLLWESMKARYEFGRENMFTKPEIFEDLMPRMLDRDGKKVLEDITKGLSEYLVFDRNHDKD